MRKETESTSRYVDRARRESEWVSGISAPYSYIAKSVLYELKIKYLLPLFIVIPFIMNFISLIAIITVFLGTTLAKFLHYDC